MPEYCLRTYERIARVEHWCDMCCTHIQPGEQYQGDVRVTESHGIIVWKTHINPPCEFPREPEYHGIEEIIKKAG